MCSPSIQVLALTREQRQRLAANAPVNNILVVGNPTMPQLPAPPGRTPLRLLPLPGAEQEALAIAQMFNTQALIGPDATEPAFVQQMSQARIILPGAVARA